MTKKIVGGGLVLFLLAAVFGCNSSARAKTPMRAGTYTASARALNGPLAVEVKLSTDAITDIKITSSVDSPGVSDWAIELMPRRIIESQSLMVDVVTGVSITSGAIIRGVEDCLGQAGAVLAEFKRPLSRTRAPDQELSADVVIVGGGGAGLSAAATAAASGASVILIEKTGFLGGNSIVSGGIYNTANPEKQDHAPAESGVEKLITDALTERPVNEEHRALIEKVRAEYEAFKRTNKTLFDSPSWHALQTWNGGDKIGTLSIIQIMTNNALAGFRWLQEQGMEFYPNVTQGSGSLYQRTFRALMPNGTGYIKAFRDSLAGRNNYSQMLDTTAKSLIVEGGRVVGVNAVGKDGHKVTLRAARGVILATGGFAGNVELRQKYCQGEKWPDLGPSLNTSNVPGVTGDGIFMAEAAGAKLVNMEQIQLLQVCNKDTGAIGGNAYPNYVAGYVFINMNGERFVREDGRRDDISKSIMAQSEGYMYLVQSADSIPDTDKALTLDGRTVTYMLENKLSGWVSAATLDGLAAEMGVPAGNLKTTIDAFNTHIDTQRPDEFGRVLFNYKYTKGPWYAFPCKPAAHHTMGGVLIDGDCRTLRADGSVIPGLYCAGEITGVVHGGNRLGGNAMVDFTVFGRIAGTNAAAGR
ncbi:MAG: FAD-dependent oxidoreductase [Spirochaetaceae bacterium]|jgi:fumarate reductase flavoprotein subunit|nr:FAD-dependent oxidoreductase [Spirochaetaceae bacterium]